MLLFLLCVCWFFGEFISFCIFKFTCCYLTSQKISEPKLVGSTPLDKIVLSVSGKDYQVLLEFLKGVFGSKGMPEKLLRKKFCF